MGKIRVVAYVCERCKHTWVPRSYSERMPFVCPKCKSPYWNIPRKKKEVSA